MDRRIGVRGRGQNVDKSKAGPRSRDSGHVAGHIQNDVAGEIQGPDARWTLARAEGDDTGGVGVRRAGDRDGTPLSVIVSTLTRSFRGMNNVELDILTIPSDANRVAHPNRRPLREGR